MRCDFQQFLIYLIFSTTYMNYLAHHVDVAHTVNDQTLGERTCADETTNAWF